MAQIPGVLQSEDPQLGKRKIENDDPFRAFEANFGYLEALGR
jgi:hypothetical protein